MARCRGSATSGNDIGQQRIFDDRDLISQPQFGLFQASDLQLIRMGSLPRCFGERGNRGIKIAMFGAQQFKAFAPFLFVHFAKPVAWLVRRRAVAGVQCGYPGALRVPARFGKVVWRGAGFLLCIICCLILPQQRRDVSVHDPVVLCKLACVWFHGSLRLGRFVAESL